MWAPPPQGWLRESQCISLGGSLGRVTATGRGVFVTGREAARRINLNLAGARIAIQGFGNVGSTAAELFAACGAKIVAVQTQRKTLISETGLDVRGLAEAAKSRGGIAAPTGNETIEREAFWDVESDILIPAALEGQVTPERARRIKAKLLLEGANGPTLPEADDVLSERGVLVVPDVICNAGGVTVSYFEWVQDFSSYFWTEDDINARLETILLNALRHIWDTADANRVGLRTATFIVACERVLMARQERGLYP
jgi:glutamate dehydrogenase (NAD(P)+)